MDSKSKKFLDWMTEIYLEQGVDIQNIKPSILHRKGRLNCFKFTQSTSKEFGIVTISPVFASGNQKVGWYIYEFEYQNFSELYNKKKPGEIFSSHYIKKFNYCHDGIMTEWEPYI